MWSRREVFQGVIGMGALGICGPVAVAERTNAPRGESRPEASGRPRPGRRPNIVFVVADDMGYGDIGAVNFGASRTPALDSLHREGTVLTQHYAGSTVCTPSRACLLTGRYPQRTGAVDTISRNGLNRLSLRETTLADVLAANGYVTGQVGKWHLGKDQGYLPHQRGFDEAANLGPGRGHWGRPMQYNGQVEAREGRYLADVITDDAVSFVRRHRDEPFFLYVAHFAPHLPLEAPDSDIQPYLDAGFSEPVSKLYGMISRMDRGIGCLMEELRQQGLEDDTLVVFTSDNGPAFATSWTDRTSLTRYNSGFRGHKDLVYEGGIRVPAVVRWPAGLPGERQVHDMTHFSDWFPTLLEAAGVGVPPGLELDGQSMLAMLKGERHAVAPRRFWQFSRYMPTPTHNAAIREGPWKLIRPCKDDVTEPVVGITQPHGLAEPTGDRLPGELYAPNLPPPLPPQLFHLGEDPGEQHDLAETQPARVKRMNDELDRWYESVMADMQNAIAS